MDLRTGRMYDSREAARAAGVPDSDIAEVLVKATTAEGRDAILGTLADCPEVRFSKGPFKDRVYKRDLRGQLVRVR